MEQRRSAHGHLAPGFLIASPKLAGGPFERAVIVMVHHDDEGAMGFIVNKPLSIDFGSLLQGAEQEVVGPVVESCYEQSVHFGGPVRVEQLWLIYQQLHPSEDVFEDMRSIEEDGLLKFDEEWYLVADSESIEEFVHGERHDPYRPYIGYTGWGPGQLEEEIEEGSWLFLEFEEDLILDQPDPEECWEDALERLGVNPMAFLMMGEVGDA